MNTEELIQFCDDWLEAWTGNRPAELLEFYAANAFYSDPGRPTGLRGHSEMEPYLTKLLAQNPSWVWERHELMPTAKGFTLKWKALIPVGDSAVEEYGLDIVEIDQGKITRNEVYFDRTMLLRVIAETNS